MEPYGTPYLMSKCTSVTINTATLYPFRNVRLEKFQRVVTYSILRQFVHQYSVIESVKGLLYVRNTAEFISPLSTVRVHVYEQSLGAKAVKRIDLKPHNLFVTEQLIFRKVIV